MLLKTKSINVKTSGELFHSSICTFQRREQGGIVFVIVHYMQRILVAAYSSHCMLAAFGRMERQHTNGLRTARTCSMSPSLQGIAGKGSQAEPDWKRYSPACSRTHHEGTERCSVADQTLRSLGTGDVSKSERRVFPAALLPSLGRLVCCEV